MHNRVNRTLRSEQFNLTAYRVKLVFGRKIEFFRFDLICPDTLVTKSLLAFTDEMIIIKKKVIIEDDLVSTDKIIEQQ